MTECEKIQNEILKGNTGAFESHLITCIECNEFYTINKKLSLLSQKKISCPSNIRFEDLFIRSSKNQTKPHSVVNIRYASLLTAAMIIMAVFIPKNTSFYDSVQPIKHSSSDKAYIFLTEGINKEINSLNLIIENLENKYNDTIYNGNSIDYDSQNFHKTYAMLTENIVNETSFIDDSMNIIEAELYSDDEIIETEIESFYEDLSAVETG